MFRQDARITAAGGHGQMVRWIKIRPGRHIKNTYPSLDVLRVNAIASARSSEPL